MTHDQSLTPLRRMGARAITAFIIANVVAILPVGLLLHSSDTWIALALGALLAVAPTLACYRDRIDPAARILYAVTLIFYPILFVYLFQRQPWQIDIHMYFFVCFSLLVLLCDRRAIAAAAALTVVHHLIVFLLIPDWVFPGSGSIPRVLLHGFMVGCEVAILWTAVNIIARLTLATRKAGADADEARIAAEQALAASRAAEARAELEHRERRAAEEALRAASDDRRRATADEIDAGIGHMVADLRLIAEQVAHQAGSITTLSRDLAAEARALRRSSEQAVGSISRVATNSDELAGSIRAVGGNAQAAFDVASETAAAIADLEPAIVTLTGEVDAARDILGLVSRIASQSNLLALNATIEAARSGEAGRGFGVVANEMKQMADATARAADDIALKLGGIVNAAAAFGDRIDWTITHVGEIAANSAAIAAGVGQQQEATQAIAESTEAVLNKVTETDDRSRTLAEIATAHQDMADAAKELAAQLGDHASALNQRMDTLIGALRAA